MRPVSATIHTVVDESLSWDAAAFASLEDTRDPKVRERKQAVKKRHVPDGSSRYKRQAGLLPPADEGDWPKWFQTSDFRGWLQQARGLHRWFAPEWESHRNIVTRCRRDRGRGRDTLSPEFRHFRDFLAWVLPNIGRKPTKSDTLDRKNFANPLYGPERVRWADKAQQAENRTTTKRIQSPDGRSKITVRQASTSSGLKADTIRKRLARGWSQANAVREHRLGGYKSPEAQPQLWPKGIDACRHARAYAAFQAVLLPDWRRQMTRPVFLACVYSPMATSARDWLTRRFGYVIGETMSEVAARSEAGLWLTENGPTADMIVALLAPPARQGARLMAAGWMKPGDHGSHEAQCGRILTRYGAMLARFELGWMKQQPAAPLLPPDPSLSPFWSQRPVSGTYNSRRDEEATDDDDDE